MVQGVSIREPQLDRNYTSVRMGFYQSAEDMSEYAFLASTVLLVASMALSHYNKERPARILQIVSMIGFGYSFAFYVASKIFYFSATGQFKGPPHHW